MLILLVLLKLSLVKNGKKLVRKKTDTNFLLVEQMSKVLTQHSFNEARSGDISSFGFENSTHSVSVLLQSFKND